MQRHWDLAGESPVRQPFAPAGSIRSSRGGDEAAEAFENGRFRRSASQQAITRLNVEQASKSLLHEPNLHSEEEGCHREVEKIASRCGPERLRLRDPAGVMTTACCHDFDATRDAAGTGRRCRHLHRLFRDGFAARDLERSVATHELRRHIGDASMNDEVDEEDVDNADPLHLKIKEQIRREVDQAMDAYSRDNPRTAAKPPPMKKKGKNS